MTPLHFEELYQPEWQKLEAALQILLGDRSATREQKKALRGEEIAALYRRACEHLALARARSYPAYLLDRLERLTSDAHQVIYQRRELGISHLLRLAARDFPRAVRAHAAYVWISAAVFYVPGIVIGLLVYFNPEFILSMVDAPTAASFEEMYSTSAESLGRQRDANTDWMMFGFYISHNIGISFQCFASGLFAGVGSLFFLAYNGAFIGAVAGYLTERGLSATFWSFVATHSSFELTAIVLSGAAGLRLGHALLAPGARSRSQSLVLAAREVSVIVYGVIAMLVIAAAIEAFWSSATWLPPALKYSVAGACWVAVLAYLMLQGRRGN
jgi:uncharacterized membrane protein SpoIIM required for sporulation